MTRARNSGWRRWMVSAALGLAAAGPAGAQASGVERVSWLAGCWQSQGRSLVTEEQWMAPRGGVLLGMSRATRGDAVVGFEFLRLYARGDTLVYAAAPSGQPPAEFRAVAPTGDEIVFENPAHDFPQRIRYRRVGRDSLLARIEGQRGGSVRGIDFPYHRVACAGDP